MKVILSLLFALFATAAFADGTSTASAPSQDEACSRAKASASNGGKITSDCSCEQKGKQIICRVQYSAPEDSDSISDAKKYLREKLNCNPDKEECPPVRIQNGGPGVRD